MAPFPAKKASDRSDASNRNVAYYELHKVNGPRGIPRYLEKEKSLRQGVITCRKKKQKKMYCGCKQNLTNTFSYLEPKGQHNVIDTPRKLERDEM